MGRSTRVNGGRQCGYTAQTAECAPAGIAGGGAAMNGAPRATVSHQDAGAAGGFNHAGHGSGRAQSVGGLAGTVEARLCSLPTTSTLGSFHGPVTR